MKSKGLFFSLLFFIFCQIAVSQNQLPSATIKSLAGKEVSFESLVAESNIPVVVSFWATWCVPCIQELETINDQLAERQKESDFKFIAISVDDTRTSAKVKSFVTGHGWDFNCYLDVNSDLKRAFNVNDIPYLLLIKNGKIVYQHTGYVPGNEEELFEKIKAR